MSGSIGDYLTPEVGATLRGEADQGIAYALEVQIGRPGREFWSPILIAHEPSVYRTLEQARKKRSYLRSFDKRTFVKIRPARIVKITVTREEI